MFDWARFHKDIKSNTVAVSGTSYGIDDCNRHRWSQWEQYYRKVIHFTFSKYMGEGVERRQRRHCLICGWEEDIEV